jgi:hypothetical protein
VEGLAPDYWMTAVLLVSSVMVPPHEHLSDDAETRTISALTYRVSLLRVVSGPAPELLGDGGLAQHLHGAAAGALVGRRGNADDLGLHVHGDLIGVLRVEPVPAPMQPGAWPGHCERHGREERPPVRIVTTTRPP